MPNGYSANPSSHSKDAERREFLLEVKWPGNEADQFLRVSTRVKNEWSRSSLTNLQFTSLRLIKYREIFQLTSRSIPNGSLSI
jgi:hypothetical protein